MTFGDALLLLLLGEDKKVDNACSAKTSSERSIAFSPTSSS